MASPSAREHQGIADREPLLSHAPSHWPVCESRAASYHVRRCNQLRPYETWRTDAPSEGRDVSRPPLRGAVDPRQRIGGRTPASNSRELADDLSALPRACLICGLP